MHINEYMNISADRILLSYRGQRGKVAAQRNAIQNASWRPDRRIIDVRYWIIDAALIARSFEQSFMVSPKVLWSGTYATSAWYRMAFLRPNKKAVPVAKQAQMHVTDTKQHRAVRKAVMDRMRIQSFGFLLVIFVCQDFPGGLGQLR